METNALINLAAKVLKMRFHDYIRGQSNAMKLLFFTGITLLSLSLIGMLASLVLPLLMHLPPGFSPQIPRLGEQGVALTYLRIMQVIQSISVFVLPAFVFAYLAIDSPLQWLGFGSFNRPARSALAGLIFIVAIQPVINYMVELNHLLPVFDWMIEAEHQAEELTQSFLQMNNPTDLLINLLVIGLLPAFGEELLFRGVLYRLSIGISRSEHKAILVTAFVFSAVHMQFLGFIPRFVLGLALGYMRKWSGSLWLPMLVHALNNSMAVVLHYGSEHGMWTTAVEVIGKQQSDGLIVFAGATIASASLLLLWRNSVKSESFKAN